MDDRKIGLTIFLLKDDRVAAFEKSLLEANQAAISLTEPFDGVFLPFPSVNSNPPTWVRAVETIRLISEES